MWPNAAEGRRAEVTPGAFHGAFVPAAKHSYFGSRRADLSSRGSRGAQGKAQREVERAAGSRLVRKQRMQWYVNQNGKTTGPFSDQRVAMLVNWGKLSDDAYLCDEEMRAHADAAYPELVSALTSA